MTRLVIRADKTVQKSRTALYLDCALHEKIESMALTHGTSFNKMSIALIEHGIELDLSAIEEEASTKKRTPK